jgi:hypothetical protein
LDDRFASQLQDAGVVISAHAPDAGPEALELAEHPFFLATAFQPQVGSSQSGELHPVLSVTSSRSHDRHVTAYTGQNGQHPSSSSPQAAVGRDEPATVRTAKSSWRRPVHSAIAAPGIPITP